MRLQRIIVPTDFSSSAENAFGFALDLAEAFDARIHLVHVYRLGYTDLGSSVQLPVEHVDQLRAHARAELDRWVERASERNIPAEADLMSGDPAQAISSLARSDHADLIVMGTRGLAGLKHLLLGSVAERTLRFSPCPVLTIPSRG